MQREYTVCTEHGALHHTMTALAVCSNPQVVLGDNQSWFHRSLPLLSFRYEAIATQPDNDADARLGQDGQQDCIARGRGADGGGLQVLWCDGGS